MIGAIKLDERIDSTFCGPIALRRLQWLLRRVPAHLAREVMAVVAVVDGTLRRDRLRRALRWAGAQGTVGWRRHRLACALLANHGRFVAEESSLGIAAGRGLRDATTLVHAERLDALDSGAIILGVHVGPPRLWLSLRAHGYPVAFVGRGLSGEGPLWDEWVRDGIVQPMPSGDASARVAALYRLRRRLAEGGLAFMAADGPLGRTLFTLDLPGGQHVIRGGWFGLRRQLGVPTLPVLIHEEDGRRVITVYPPLPDVDPDDARDLETCRAALTSLMLAYVQRVPDQCRYLAFPPWDA